MIRTKEALERLRSHRDEFSYTAYFGMLFEIEALKDENDYLSKDEIDEIISYLPTSIIDGEKDLSAEELVVDDMVAKKDVTKYVQQGYKTLAEIETAILRDEFLAMEEILF